MPRRTISMSVGKGSVSHNMRLFHADNTDPTRTHLNQTVIHQSIKDTYHQLFDQALQRFNAKQTRKDRCITDYYEKIRTSKQEKLFHEVIVQIGNREDTEATTQEGVQAANILTAYLTDFSKRNPHLHVFSAHLHMDEATPHLHIDFVPFTTGSKRGLDTRVSLKQALASQGFRGGTRGQTEWAQWVQSEKEVLASYMQAQGLEWEQKGTHNEHLSVLDFKKQERSKEISELSDQLALAKKEIKTIASQKVKIANVDAIEGKPSLLDKQKITIDKPTFDAMKTLAKKQIVSSKKTATLTSEVKRLKAQNQALQDQNTVMQQALDARPSIKEQLRMHQLEHDYKQVCQKLRKVMVFIQGLNLQAKLEQFLKHQPTKGTEHGKSHLR